MLGRPVQAFERLAHQLARQVMQRLQQTGHRAVTMHITGALFTPVRPGSAAMNNALEIDLHRATVLGYMQARLGFTDASLSDAQLQTLPSNATEIRIGETLRQAITLSVRECLPPAREVDSQVQLWQWEAQIQIDTQLPRRLTVQLDPEASQSLEEQVAQHRRSVQRQRTAPVKAAHPLPVQLVAVLVEQKVSAAHIQALKPGSVLPISLGRATVLLNDEPMLSASVAEHQGKLNLTAFETLE